MNPFYTILEQFRIKKTIRFHGTIEHLETIMEEIRMNPIEKEEFSMIKTGKLQYEINPRISIGTMYMKSAGSIINMDDIKVQMEFISKKENLQEIRLMGSIQRGHLLIFFAFLFAFIGSIYLLFSQGEFSLFILITAIWPIFHLWFNFVWTSQEKALIEDIKLALAFRIKAGTGNKKQLYSNP